MSKVLVIVDMQVDFLSPSGALYLGHDSSALIKRIASFANSFDGDIFITKDLHYYDSHEFDKYAKHCLAGYKGAELVPEIQAIADLEHTRIFRKNTFGSSSLARATKSYEEIHMVGVATHICVFACAMQIQHIHREEENEVPNMIIDLEMVDDFDDTKQHMAVNYLEAVYGVKII